MIGLAAPGAKIASGPHTPSVAEEYRVAGAAGEQPRAAPEVDDYSGGVEYDSADVPDKGGGDDVARVELVAGGGFAAPIVDRGRVGRLNVYAGQLGEVMFEADLVDEDVDERVGRVAHTRCCCGVEDRQQGVEAPLGAGSLEQCGVHLLAPSGDPRVPVCAELGVAEPIEDLLDHRPGDNTTARVEIDTLADDADVCIATSVGSLVSVVGAVGVGEGFPATHHHGELVEPQALGVPDQQLGRVGQLGGAARVGEQASQQSHLTRSRRAGVRRLAHHRYGV